MQEDKCMEQHTSNEFRLVGPNNFHCINIRWHHSFGLCHPNLIHYITVIIIIIIIMSNWALSTRTSTSTWLKYEYEYNYSRCVRAVEYKYRCQVLQVLYVVHHQTEFVLNTPVNGQPVQLQHRRHHVISLSEVEDETCCWVSNTLKWSQWWFW